MDRKTYYQKMIMNLKLQYKIVIALLNAGQLSYSQNVILNPGFEQYDICSQAEGNIDTVSYWANASAGSPDYYNPCNAIIVNSPSNFAGYQVAYEGTSYVGIGFNKIINAKESIQGQISQPLIAGKNYCLEMAISLSNIVSYSIDKIGVYLTEDTIIASDYTYNNDALIPQIIIDINAFKDTASWMVVSGNHIATGGEKYLLISGFGNLIYTKFRADGIDDFNSYYYIDNVSLTECPKPPDVFLPPSIPNVITPDGNGTNEAFFIGNLPPKSRFSVYSRWGNLVYTSTDYQNDWEGTSGNGERLHEDTYYYILQTPDGKTYSSFFSLMRCLK